MYWLGEGHLQPPEVHGDRYAAVIGWSALGGEKPEEMEGVVEHSTMSPNSLVLIRFLHVVDSDAADALEAAAGRVCTAQVRVDCRSRTNHMTGAYRRLIPGVQHS